MLEIVEDGFFTLDREWRFVRVNAQTGRLLQRQCKALLGCVIEEEFPETRRSAFEAPYRLPVMDGPSTIHVLMRMNPGVRIIAASGISSNSAVARGAGPSIREFLPKPYTAQTLLRTLQEVIEATA